MSVADAIYGVTMAESGVSRRMAMRLEEAEDVAESEKIETLGLGV
jgi:chromosome segregation ATPase